jgi:hypothetical protein
MVIQIDKNIPVPAETEVWGNTKYPWLEMGIGDSFFQSPDGSEDQKACRTRMVGARTNRRREHGEDYVIACVTENGIDGVRVWKTK